MTKDSKEWIREKKGDEFTVKTRSFKENYDNSFLLLTSLYCVCIMSTFFFVHNFGALQKIVLLLYEFLHGFMFAQNQTFLFCAKLPINAYTHTHWSCLLFYADCFSGSICLTFQFLSFFSIVRLKYKHVPFIREHTHTLNMFNATNESKRNRKTLRQQQWEKNVVPPKKWRKL